MFLSPSAPSTNAIDKIRENFNNQILNASKNIENNDNFYKCYSYKEVKQNLSKELKSHNNIYNQNNAPK